MHLTFLQYKCYNTILNPMILTLNYILTTLSTVILLEYNPGYNCDICEHYF